MKLRLYEITDELAKLEQELLDCQEAAEEEMLRLALNTMYATKEKKIGAAVNMYKCWVSMVASIREDVKRNGERARVIERKATNFKNYIAWCLKPGEEIKTTEFSVTWRPSKAVEITDESLVPDHLFRVKREVAKDRIKELFESGCEVPGATYAERKHLVIK
jgi:hypothetical protein